MLNAILWATAGAVIYKFLATVFQIGHATIFAQKVITHCLILLGEVAHDIAFLKELKHRVSLQTLTKEQAEYIKDLDDQLLDNWKNNSIRIFHNTFTGNMSSFVKFSNWSEAMKQLEEEVKNR